MFLALLLLAACGSEISITVETAECTDYDFDDPQEDLIESVELDGDWYISHKGVFQGCVDLFTPEVAGKGRTITVREYWEPRTLDDCTLCFAPTIIVEQPPPGSYEVSWYLEDEEEPIDVVVFEVE
jgi:hypothetical protein